MKIFNILKGKNQMFIIGVLVFVLLTSTVGVVSGESAADPNSNQVTAVGEFIHPTEGEYEVSVFMQEALGFTDDRIINYPLRAVSLKYDPAGGQVSGVGEIEAKNSCFRLNLNVKLTGSAYEIETESGKKVLHFQGEVEGTETNSGRLCSDSRDYLFEPLSTAEVVPWKAQWSGDLDYETGTITGQIDRMFYVAPSVEWYLEFELNVKEVPSEEKEEARPLSITVMSDKKVQGQETIYRPGETETFSGYVSDGEGNTVERATVSTQVTNPSGKTYLVEKTTDDFGYYEVVIKFLEDAAMGQWNITVTASKDKYQKASDTTYVEVQAEKVLDISVLIGNEIYSRGDRATISGYVSDGEGNFVEGAEVSILFLNPNDRPYQATTTTNKGGCYQVLNSFGETAITGEWMINVTASKDGYQEDSAYRTIYYEVMTLGIHSERMRLQKDYKELMKGHLLFSEGMVSTATDIASLGLARNEFGHVGIYIGDFQVPKGKTYKVRDKAQVPLKVFRNGKPKMLNFGDNIIEGDWLIGAVAEARGNGIVFTTVDGMKAEAERWMKGPANFAWKTTRPPPTPDQVTKICEFALSKVNLTEKGGVQYDVCKKGSRDWTTKQEEWDCVNLAEAAYEYAGLDPTPAAIEYLLMCLLPEVMFSLIDMPRHPPQEFTQKAIKAIDIIVKSPVKLHLYDSEGRHVGVNPQGVIERDIHSAFYYAEVEEYPQGIAILDVKDEYTLMIEALDEGSFDLIIQDLNVCTPGSTTKIEFQEVTITKDTQATLNLGSTGNEYLMRIDKDGDGKVDETLEPTSLITTPLPAETTPERIGLTFESRSKPSGSSVQIPLTLNGIEENIGNMDITISYDPSVLEATEVIKGSLTTNSIFDYNILNQGTIKISLADSQGFSGDGSIAYVKFNVIGSEGSSSSLQIVEIAANRAEDYETLEIPTIDGVFRVISMEEGMGDSDGDGRFTALDALYALQMAVGKIPEDLVMDMNGDGSVTSLDARNILRIAVGIESK